MYKESLRTLLEIPSHLNTCDIIRLESESVLYTKYDDGIIGLSGGLDLIRGRVSLVAPILRSL